MASPPDQAAGSNNPPPSFFGEAERELIARFLAQG